MNSNILSRQQQYAVVILSVILSVMVVWAAAYGATTISANINTGGTLTVTGASTLTGAVTTDAGLTVGTTLSVGTTSGFTGLTTHTAGAIMVASSTAVAAFNVTGATTLSNTLAVTGAATFSNSLTTATSTATTTIALQSDANSEGGCIQIRSTDGTRYRMYLAPGDSTAATTTAGGKTGLIAVWEAGACQ